MDRETAFEVIEDVEEEILAEDKLGASRDQIVEGTCQRIRDRLRDELNNGDKWFIHRFECPDCGAVTRSDSAVGCFNCGTQMEHVERIATIGVPDDV